MLKKHLLFLFLCLALFASACSGEPAPAVTKAQEEPTRAATPQLDPNCSPIMEHVKAMRGASSEEQPTASVEANSSLLKGKIMCLLELSSSQLRIQPEKKIYAAVIEIIEAGDLQGQQNLLAGHETEFVTVFAEAPFVYDKQTLETLVIVSYQDDRAGGAFWVIGDQFTVVPFESALTAGIEYN